MTKYFVTSDIHGFFDEFQHALDATDFDPGNADHVLIICGDAFDRGSQPLEIYDFLREIPKERKILIRGNHELLLKELYERGYPLDHDINNGTYDTLAYISKQPDRDEYRRKIVHIIAKYETVREANGAIEAEQEKRRKKLFNSRKLKEILKWIDSEWVDYYETDDFIFVHSFIPTKIDEKKAYFGGVEEEEFDPDWRNANDWAWERAKWGCPWKKLQLNKTGKTMICGHWHTSDFWNNLVYHENKLSVYEDNPIFYRPDIPLIGLDACTAATGGVNILTIEGKEIKCYNHNEK